jgi:hypothetical protein
MSWLSELFGGGGEDPEAVRQRAAGQARIDAENAAKAAASQQQMQIDYLNSLRADQAAKDAKMEAMDPTALRTSAMNTIGGYFTPEFENTFVPGGITDPLEQQIYGEQRGTADEYLNRLFKRGVITESGKAAAAADLDKQGARVRQQLQDISDAIIGAEREKIGGIAGRAKERASGLNVGESFDLTPYSSAAQSELGTFQGGLGDLFKSQVPDNLFDTSALGSIAGGAQFAGNRPFEPDITPGTPAPKEEEDPYSGQKPVQKRTSVVF